MGKNDLIAEVIKGQWQLAHVFAQQRHDCLQVIAFCAGDAYGVALNGGLDFDFGVFDELNDFFRVVRGHAIFDFDALFDFVAADFLYIFFDEETYVYIAFGAFVAQDVEYLAELKLGVGKGGSFEFFLFHACIGAFEVKTTGDFFVALVYSVAQFDGVGFEYGIE